MRAITLLRVMRLRLVSSSRDLVHRRVGLGLVEGQDHLDPCPHDVHAHVCHRACQRTPRQVIRRFVYSPLQIIWSWVLMFSFRAEWAYVAG